MFGALQPGQALGSRLLQRLKVLAFGAAAEPPAAAMQHPPTANTASGPGLG